MAEGRGEMRGEASGAIAVEPAVARVGGARVGEWTSTEVVVRNGGAGAAVVTAMPSAPDRWRCAPRALRLEAGAAGALRLFVRPELDEGELPGVEHRDAFYISVSDGGEGAQWREVAVCHATFTVEAAEVAAHRIPAAERPVAEPFAHQKAPAAGGDPGSEEVDELLKAEENARASEVEALESLVAALSGASPDAAAAAAAAAARERAAGDTRAAAALRALRAKDAEITALDERLQASEARAGDEIASLRERLHYSEGEAAAMRLAAQQGEEAARRSEATLREARSRDAEQLDSEAAARALSARAADLAAAEQAAMARASAAERRAEEAEEALADARVEWEATAAAMGDALEQARAAAARARESSREPADDAAPRSPRRAPKPCPPAGAAPAAVKDIDAAAIAALEANWEARLVDERATLSAELARVRDSAREAQRREAEALARTEQAAALAAERGMQVQALMATVEAMQPTSEVEQGERAASVGAQAMAAHASTASMMQRQAQAQAEIDRLAEAERAALARASKAEESARALEARAAAAEDALKLERREMAALRVQAEQAAAEGESLQARLRSLGEELQGARAETNALQSMLDDQRRHTEEAVSLARKEGAAEALASVSPAGATPTMPGIETLQSHVSALEAALEAATGAREVAEGRLAAVVTAQREARDAGDAAAEERVGVWRQRVSALSESLNAANAQLIDVSAAKKAADMRTADLQRQLDDLTRASAEKLERVATLRASNEVAAMSYPGASDASNAERIAAAAALAEPLTAAAAAADAARQRSALMQSALAEAEERADMYKREAEEAQSKLRADGASGGKELLLRLDAALQEAAELRDALLRTEARLASVETPTRAADLGAALAAAAVAQRTAVAAAVARQAKRYEAQLQHLGVTASLEAVGDEPSAKEAASSESAPMEPSPVVADAARVDTPAADWVRSVTRHMANMQRERAHVEGVCSALRRRLQLLRASLARAPAAMVDFPATGEDGAAAAFNEGLLFSPRQALPLSEARENVSGLLGLLKAHLTSATEQATLPEAGAAVVQAEMASARIVVAELGGAIDAMARESAARGAETPRRTADGPGVPSSTAVAQENPTTPASATKKKKSLKGGLKAKATPSEGSELNKETKDGRVVELERQVVSLSKQLRALARSVTMADNATGTPAQGSAPETARRSEGLAASEAIADLAAADGDEDALAQLALASAAAADALAEAATPSSARRAAKASRLKAPTMASPRVFKAGNTSPALVPRPISRLATPYTRALAAKPPSAAKATGKAMSTVAKRSPARALPSTVESATNTPVPKRGVLRRGVSDASTNTPPPSRSSAHERWREAKRSANAAGADAATNTPAAKRGVPRRASDSSSPTPRSRSTPPAPTSRGTSRARSVTFAEGTPSPKRGVLRRSAGTSPEAGADSGADQTPTTPDAPLAYSVEEAATPAAYRESGEASEADTPSQSSIQFMGGLDRAPTIPEELRAQAMQLAGPQDAAVRLEILEKGLADAVRRPAVREGSSAPIADDVSSALTTLAAVSGGSDAAAQAEALARVLQVLARACSGAEEQQRALLARVEKSEGQLASAASAAGAIESRTAAAVQDMEGIVDVGDKLEARLATLESDSARALEAYATKLSEARTQAAAEFARLTEMLTAAEARADAAEATVAELMVSLAERGTIEERAVAAEAAAAELRTALEEAHGALAEVEKAAADATASALRGEQTAAELRASLAESELARRDADETARRAASAAVEAEATAKRAALTAADAEVKAGARIRELAAELAASTEEAAEYRAAADAAAAAAEAAESRARAEREKGGATLEAATAAAAAAAAASDSRAEAASVAAAAAESLLDAERERAQLMLEEERERNKELTSAAKAATSKEKKATRALKEAQREAREARTALRALPRNQQRQDAPHKSRGYGVRVARAGKPATHALSDGAHVDDGESDVEHLRKQLAEARHSRDRYIRLLRARSSEASQTEAAVAASANAAASAALVQGERAAATQSELKRTKLELARVRNQVGVLKERLEVAENERARADSTEAAARLSAAKAEAASMRVALRTAREAADTAQVRARTAEEALRLATAEREIGAAVDGIEGEEKARASVKALKAQLAAKSMQVATLRKELKNKAAEAEAAAAAAAAASAAAERARISRRAAKAAGAVPSAAQAATPQPAPAAEPAGHGDASGSSATSQREREVDAASAAAAAELAELSGLSAEDVLDVLT